jgi:RNA polymerase sigma-70 factor, ECF subfamily
METDEDLLQRIGGGDEEAFNAFFARNREAVLRHVERIVVDGDAAEDVVQETFLSVWRNGRRWEHRGNARGWVFRIATNLSLNLLESRRRSGRLTRPSVEDGEDIEDLFSRIADSAEARPEGILERSDRIRLVRDSVERLPEGKRQVLEIYLKEDVTLGQIAKRLDLPLGTVKSRFHYALQELRELLDGFDG